MINSLLFLLVLFCAFTSEQEPVDSFTSSGSSELNTSFIFKDVDLSKKIISTIDEETLRARLKKIDDLITPLNLIYNNSLLGYVERKLRMANYLGKNKK